MAVFLFMSMSYSQTTKMFACHIPVFPTNEQNVRLSHQIGRPNEQNVRLASTRMSDKRQKGALVQALATNNMKRIIIYLLLFLLSSCNSRKQDSSQGTFIKSNTASINSIGIKKDTLDSLKLPEFNFRADSLISIILNKPTHFQLITDTINPSKITTEERTREITGYLSTKSKLLLKHYFELGKPNSRLSFIIYEARFISQKSLDTTFSYLNYLANEDDVDAQAIYYAPGLTYMNDYVIKQTEYLVWLNTPCAYSYTNHLKYIEFLKASLTRNIIADSIICACGAVNCK
jgi:hypothetical protein